MKKKITYSKSGVDYAKLDPIKKMAQDAAQATSKNLKKHGFSEISDTRGESAYVWSLGSARDKRQGLFMASVVEGLGTKNLVADAVYNYIGKSYYDIIAQDTVATIINDLVSVGATPLILNAYWAQSHGSFLSDPKRMKDFIRGWSLACNLSGVSWGGGETPALSGIVEKNTADLGGSAVGIISSRKNLITDKKLKTRDRILLCRSNGINANGISLARAVSKKLSRGYGTKINSKLTYGEAILTKSNIYAKVIQDLQIANVDIHYISNITGHGLRKIMRARPKFTYVIEKVFKPQPVFDFIQKHANLSDYEMYETYNMGQDYALFIPQKDMSKALEIIKKNKFTGINAGVVKKGGKQVIIREKNIIFKGDTLDLR